MLHGSFFSMNPNSFASMLQCALDEQKKKLEGDMARHLAFIDRLLADKDKLSAKCMQLGKDMKVKCMHHKFIMQCQLSSVGCSVSFLLKLDVYSLLRCMQNCAPCKISDHAKSCILQSHCASGKQPRSVICSTYLDC